MMTTMRSRTSRIILGGGMAVSACPAGESEDLYTTACTPELVPNSPSPLSTITGNPDMPAIDGIPCGGHNSGQCIGLAEE
jgi:hypothetical protein